MSSRSPGGQGTMKLTGFSGYAALAGPTARAPINVIRGAGKRINGFSHCFPPTDIPLVSVGLCSVGLFNQPVALPNRIQEKFGLYTYIGDPPGCLSISSEIPLSVLSERLLCSCKKQPYKHSNNHPGGRHQYQLLCLPIPCMVQIHYIFPCIPLYECLVSSVSLQINDIE